MDAKMTVKERLIQMCVERGMFKNEANKVINKAIGNMNEHGWNQIKWNDLSEEYPDSVYAVLFLTICEYVIEWSNANCPNAFYRPEFEQYILQWSKGK